MPNCLDDILYHDISGKGVPKPEEDQIENLENLLKRFANKKEYDRGIAE